MAQSKHNSLKAGLLIILSFVLIFAVIVFIKGVRAMFVPMQTRQAKFALRDDLGGLRPGDNLRVGGYTVGAVDSITIIRPALVTEQPYILVRFSLPATYTLRQGAYLAVGGTLTGTSWLNFSDLGTGPALPKNLILRGHANPTSRVVAAVTALVPQIKQTLTKVNTTTIPRLDTDLTKFGQAADAVHTAADSGSQLLATVQQRIKPVVATYDAIAARADNMLVQVSKLAHSGRVGAVDNLTSATAALKQKLPVLLKHVDKLLSSAQSTLALVNKTFTNTTAITTTAKSMVDRNEGRINTLIRSLEAAAENLKQASVEIRHSPWRLIYKPSKKEMSNLNLYDAVRSFGSAARHLRHAAAALAAAAKNPSIPPAKVRQLMQQLQTTARHFHAVERKLWSAVKP